MLFYIYISNYQMSQTPLEIYIYKVFMCVLMNVVISVCPLILVNLENGL